ncbi:hypothetical protein SAMN04488506_1195 [Desemzia incerta]|uniref:KTSC domain-containing protein n=1 Tax=Desemzia incerta TaxID=82801 RepID=A0A1I5X5B2_9LACT|nr:hypothetical protein [Desemzia incerta]SFQ27114.1 hypothetical protein SAMN04488506_1195 [Desemzia incerta]
MESEMIYKVTYDSAAIILNTNEMVIYYASEPGRAVSYEFTTQTELLKSYEYCMDLMDYLEKEPQQFEDIETAHKRGLELVLGD